MKTKTLKLQKVLNADRLRGILDEGKPVEQVVMELFQTGLELATAVDVGRYASWDDFIGHHKAGESGIVDLEGDSTIDDDHVVVLLDCPMADTMKELNVDGAPPAFHKQIVEDYKDQNPGSNAILHPGCIAHQVSRQLITKSIEVDGKFSLNFYQLACRSMASGAVVYDENGLNAVGMSKEQADKLIEGKACLYVIVSSE